MLQIAGWPVGKDRVQRIWRREGLKVPKKHRPRGRLWLNDSSCIRLRPERANHVWSFGFVESRTHDGRSLRIMTLIDEHTRECLALKVARRINSFGVIETLAAAMLEKGVPEHVRCDNGPEMIAKALREWLARLGTQPLYIEPGSPWENGDLRELQRQAPGRVPEARDLLQLTGSAGCDRRVEGPLQSHPAALGPGLPATSARHPGDRARHLPTPTTMQ